VFDAPGSMSGNETLGIPNSRARIDEATVASSRQGGIVFSSARDVVLQAISTAKTMQRLKSALVAGAYRDRATQPRGCPFPAPKRSQITAREMGPSSQKATGLFM
jgi:hypothetical protein